MIRRILLALVLVGLVGGGVWALTHSRSDAKGGDAKPEGKGADAKGGDGKARVVPVVTAVVVQQDVPLFLEGLGNAVGFNTVTVKTQVDGRLMQVLFREGQAVHRGDLLAQIDPRPFEVQLHQAQGALARDQALVRAAKVNLERYTGLAGQKLVAQQQADDQKALVGQYEGSLRIDASQVEAAELNLEYARIRAPVDGVTGVRLVDAGNVVHASDATGLVVLTQIDPISVLFSLPQDELPRVVREQAKRPLVAEAYARDGRAKLGTGQVVVIDNQINAATATMRMKAVFPNPAHALWPNAFVKVKLLLETLPGALVVPAVAIQRGPKGMFVYVVAEDQTVAVRPVDVLTTIADVAIISDGVKVGEQIVIEGQSALRPGAKVQPRPAGAQKGKITQRESGGAAP